MQFLLHDEPNGSHSSDASAYSGYGRQDQRDVHYHNYAKGFEFRRGFLLRSYRLQR